MGSQQRSSGRIGLTQVEGKYRMLDSDEKWEHCDIVNISLGGLFIVGTKSFLEGDELELCFSLEAQQMFMQLEVTNVHGKSCGAKFKVIHEKEKDLIQKYINRHYFKK